MHAFYHWLLYIFAYDIYEACVTFHYDHTSNAHLKRHRMLRLPLLADPAAARTLDGAARQHLRGH